jgi:molybdopterin molybdotransferase
MMDSVPSEPISIDEARARVLAEIHPLPAERVPVAGALGRVLAEEVRSGGDLPPFDSSAMDGYAVVAVAEPAELEVVAEARAGAPASHGVEPGEAVRISTGARMPPGADAVVPSERVTISDGRVAVPPVAAGANVRRAGEDVKAGAAVLEPGTELGPAELAMLASLGHADVLCSRAPRVAIVVTGDELVEPGGELASGRIFNSNGPALAALAARAGALVASNARAPDEREATRAALRHALEDTDVVCVSGGVSVGPHDHVKPALADLFVEERFWGVALKPGKPTWFGVCPTGPIVFGLPGNPVSAMVTFQLFARPALRALAGADPSASRVRARLDAPVARNPRREQAVRCRLRAADDGWHVEPTGPQGSHQLSSMLGAGALALIGRGEGEVAAGELVDIELLPGGTVGA